MCGRRSLRAGNGSLRTRGRGCPCRCGCLPLRGGLRLRIFLPDRGLLSGGLLRGRVQRNVNIKRPARLRNRSRFPQGAAALLHGVARRLGPGPRGAPARFLLASAPKESGKPSFFFPFVVSAGHPSHLTFPISLRPQRALCEKKSRPAMERGRDSVLYIIG